MSGVCLIPGTLVEENGENSLNGPLRWLTDESDHRFIWKHVLLTSAAAYSRFCNLKKNLRFHQRLFKETTSIGVKVRCSYFLFESEGQRKLGIHQLSPCFLTPGIGISERSSCEALVNALVTVSVARGDFWMLQLISDSVVCGEQMCGNLAGGKVQKFPDVENLIWSRLRQQFRWVLNLPPWLWFMDSSTRSQSEHPLKFLISKVGFRNFHLFLVESEPDEGSRLSPSISHRRETPITVSLPKLVNHQNIRQHLQLKLRGSERRSAARTGSTAGGPWRRVDLASSPMTQV